MGIAALNENEICQIYFSSFHIPSGIFAPDGKLKGLYSSFGKWQTDMYIRDTAEVLAWDGEGAESGYDGRGSAWCRIPYGEDMILFGPVQTGRNPTFSYEGIPEHTGDSFAAIARSLVLLLKGKETVLRERQDEGRVNAIARIMYDRDSDLLSFDDLFDCVREGDVAELNRRMSSGEFMAYQDKMVSDWSTGNTIFMFNLAKTYHTAQEAAVPIGDLTPLVDIYLREKDTYSSLASLKSGMQRMIYDFTRYVHQYRDRRYSALVNMAIMYIKEHLYRQITVKEIADYCAVSISSLQHRFKEETGQSVSERILSYKMEKASYFLRHTQLPCGDIAFKMGFCSQSYFIKQFKKVKGMTPLEYRACV